MDKLLEHLKARMEWWKEQSFVSKILMVFGLIMVIGVLSAFFSTAKASTLTLSWTPPTMLCNGDPITNTMKGQMRYEIFYSTNEFPVGNADCTIPSDPEPVNIPRRDIGPNVTKTSFEVVGGMTYYATIRACLNDHGCGNFSNLVSKTFPDDPQTPPVDPPPGTGTLYRPGLIVVEDEARFVGGPFSTVMRFESDPMIAMASGRWQIDFQFTKGICPTDTQVVLSRDESGQTDPGHVSFAVQDIGTHCEMRARFQSGDTSIPAWAANGVIDMTIPGAAHQIMFSFGADASASLDGVDLPPSGTTPFPMGLDQNALPLIFNGTCWSKQDAINTCGPGMAEEPTAVFGGWSSLQIFDQ